MIQISEYQLHIGKILNDDGTESEVVRISGSLAFNKQFIKYCRQMGVKDYEPTFQEKVDDEVL